MTEATQTQSALWPTPHWARESHPVYRREMERWGRTRGVIRSLRRGCAPLAFLFFAGVGCLCGLTVLDDTLEPQQRVLVWGLIVLWALLVGQTFVSFATGLIATALPATVISGEIESETYSLLRVTGVPTNEIVLAKYAAALRQLIVPLAVIIGARLLLVIGGLSAADYALRLEGSTGGLFDLLGEIPLDIVGPFSILTILASGLGWLAYFFLKPVLNVMLYASVGLFGSSMARTRVNGVITAIGLRVLLWVLRVIAEQIFGVGGQLSIAYGISATNLDALLETLLATQPATIASLGGLFVLVGLLVAIVWRVLVTYALVRATVQRAQHLPYG